MSNDGLWTHLTRSNGQRLGSEMPGSFPTDEEQDISTERSYVTFPSMDTETQQVWKDNAAYYFQLCVIFPLNMVLQVASHLVIVVARLPLVQRLHLLSQQSFGKASPADKAGKFIREFEERYSPLVSSGEMPPFMECSYTHALYTAKKQAKFLLIWLQNDDHDDTAPFIMDYLLSSEFVRLIEEHKMLLWGGNTLESEAYQVSNNLHVTKFPVMLLLCLTSAVTETANGPVSSTPKLTTVLKLQGLPKQPGEFLSLLRARIGTYEPNLVSIRGELQEAEVSKMIRLQQDEAYQTSLRQDRENAQRRAVERERQLQLEKQAKERDNWVKWKAITLPTEPAEGARVAIRLPSGQKVLRRFLATQLLVEIFDFVEVARNGLLGYTGHFRAPEPGYHHEFTFRVFSVVPKKELLPNPVMTVQEEDTVWPNGNLVVEAEQV
ncbi:hypothetical protein BABINDRAFT_160922 [Babjeviella inositovora NRRL Y-12698]|uniref:UBX domain-containing protein n=1 Tax=Babjeviella inositovora NRRL Y-12698 TaxID=984486 RepID=A0A1E3QUQ7_9ASCO|nr:uncharacterized protein BABINDRAFT_160922 [Babjeviella inositovora NRRL Y-12698]ODQ80687.1 hypothetical protein BABINDRAFT_160922 [Babjeviella inositovora NRRL Y-12698]